MAWLDSRFRGNDGEKVGWRWERAGWPRCARNDSLNETGYASVQGLSKVTFHPLMVSLSNHKPHQRASFDKLRMSEIQ